MNTVFHKIDFETWPRKQYFYYFTKMLPTGFNISVDINVTNTYNHLKTQGKKFFPAYLYLTTKLINEQPLFRTAYLNNELGYYEVLHPSYACFHEDDHTMSNMWTEYNGSFREFYLSYIEDQNNYGSHHGILARPEIPPVNSYMVGLIPWISFKSYSPIPLGGGTLFFPVLEAGKFKKKEGRIIMPLSMMVHHAIADGYHVSEFINQLQLMMDHPENWVND